MFPFTIKKENTTTLSLYKVSILVFIFWSNALALEFSGHYENTGQAFRLGEDSYLQDANTIELNLSSQAGEHFFFYGSLQWQRYFGKTSYKASEYLPDEMQDSPLLFLLDMVPLSINDTAFVNQAYASWQHERTLVTLGIQPIQWGSGYAWNPSDIWNRKDPLDPRAAQPGDMALRLEQGWGDLSLSLIAGVPENWKETPASFQAKYFWGGFDWALTATHTIRETMDWNALLSLLSQPGLDELSLMASLANGMPMQKHRNTTLGLWWAGQIGEVGFWSENALHLQSAIDESPNTDSLHWQLLSGLDYTIGWGNGLYLVAEYLWDSEARPAGEAYTISDWLSLLDGNTLVMGQHNLFAGMQYGLELSTWSLFVIANLSDGSAAWTPRVGYSFSENVDGELMGVIPTSKDEGTQYGLGQYSVIGKIKVYF
jgi:hypothetical protein